MKWGPGVNCDDCQNHFECWKTEMELNGNIEVLCEMTLEEELLWIWNFKIIMQKYKIDKHLKIQWFVRLFWCTLQAVEKRGSCRVLCWVLFGAYYSAQCCLSVYRLSFSNWLLVLWPREVPVEFQIGKCLKPNLCTLLLFFTVKFICKCINVNFSNTRCLFDELEIRNEATKGCVFVRVRRLDTHIHILYFTAFNHTRLQSLALTL